MVLQKYAHCFAILMRLRQLCLHPSLCAKDCEWLQKAQNILQGIVDQLNRRQKFLRYYGCAKYGKVWILIPTVAEMSQFVNRKVARSTLLIGFVPSVSESPSNKPM